MNHLGTVTLETPRLILRRITLDDAEAMFKNWASNENVARFLTWDAHDNIDKTKKIISAWLKEYESDDTYRWVIVLKDITEPIGIIDVVALDKAREDARIGYCIGENFWNNGIMTEAFKEVISFLFEKVNLHRIIARHIKENIGSGKVMSKSGLKYEGTLIDNEEVKGEWRDMCEYSLFKSEYKG